MSDTALSRMDMPDRIATIHEALWPNGYGVGLRNQRLQVGVLPGSFFLKGFKTKPVTIYKSQGTHENGKRHDVNSSAFLHEPTFK